MERIGEMTLVRRVFAIRRSGRGAQATHAVASTMRARKKGCKLFRGRFAQNVYAEPVPVLR